MCKVQTEELNRGAEEPCFTLWSHMHDKLLGRSRSVIEVSGRLKLGDTSPPPGSGVETPGLSWCWVTHLLVPASVLSVQP